MSSLIEEEYEQLTAQRAWKPFYERIKNEASIMHGTCTIRHAKLPENRERNRYRDVSPYDDSRVLLENFENDYINASMVQVPLAKRTYILTQGPLINTSGHFWLMVWQQNSKGVLMLNKIIEDGRLKCHCYFPTGSEFGGEDSLIYDDVDLRVDFVEHDDKDYYIKRTLNLVHLKTGEVKSVYQFQYIAWPDFGIPSDTALFLDFLHAVRQSGVIPSSKDYSLGPPIVHCSAGIGRSGTFCLVDSALVVVERTKTLNTLNVKDMLLDMRKYRAGLIQTADQLRFSYMAILDGAQTLLSPVDGEDSDGTESDDTDDLLNVPADGTLSLPDSDDQQSDFEVVPSAPVEVPAAGADDEDVESRAQALKRPSDLQNTETEPDVKRQPSNCGDESKPSPIPPTRTSSLQKAASLDQAPPPVPPRPPSGFSRQVSAPPVPDNGVKVSKEGQPDVVEEEDGYVNTSGRPIQISKKNRIAQRREREEKNRKLKEQIDATKANMKAVERRKDLTAWFKSNALWLGALTVITVAVGYAWYNGKSFPWLNSRL